MIWLSLLACSKKVAYLSPRDPRLPTEAGRWLADAEDEVSIAQAGVEDTTDQLRRVQDYVFGMTRRLKRSGASTLSQSFNEYAGARVELQRRHLRSARKREALAWARLEQARAETAARYDLAVYELGDLELWVEGLRAEVAEAEKLVEQQRGMVQETSKRLWSVYSAHVSAGGDRIALWQGED